MYRFADRKFPQMKVEWSTSAGAHQTETSHPQIYILPRPRRCRSHASSCLCHQLTPPPPPSPCHPSLPRRRRSARLFASFAAWVMMARDVRNEEVAAGRGARVWRPIGSCGRAWLGFGDRGSSGGAANASGDSPMRFVEPSACKLS